MPAKSIYDAPLPAAKSGSIYDAPVARKPKPKPIVLAPALQHAIKETIHGGAQARTAASQRAAAPVNPYARTRQQGVAPTRPAAPVDEEVRPWTHSNPETVDEVLGRQIKDFGRSALAMATQSPVANGALGLPTKAQENPELIEQARPAQTLAGLAAGVGAIGAAVPAAAPFIGTAFGAQGAHGLYKRATGQAPGFREDPAGTIMDLAMILGLKEFPKAAGSVGRGAKAVYDMRAPAIPPHVPFGVPGIDVAPVEPIAPPVVPPLGPTPKARPRPIPTVPVGQRPIPEGFPPEAIAPVEAAPVAAPVIPAAKPRPVVPKAQRVKAAKPVEAAPAPAPVQTPEAPATAQVGAQGGKEPWQMTESEFRDAATGKSFDEAYDAMYSAGQQMRAAGERMPDAHPLVREASRRDAERWAARNALAANHGDGNVSLYEHQWKRVDTTGEHKSVVQRAIDEGKPVPPEVLADYPDLKPAPSAAPAAPKEPWQMTRQEFQEWGAQESKLPLDERSALIDGTHADMWAKTHATLVRKAVEQGLPVPKEVLESVGQGKAPSVEAKPSARFAIRPATYQGEPRFVVQMGEKPGLGDAVFRTEAEAKAHIDNTIARERSSAEMAARDEAKAKAEQEERNRVHGRVDQFVEKMAPTQRALAVRTLDKTISVNGKIAPRHAHVEEAIGNGYKVVTKGGTRTLVSPNGGFHTEADITKTAMDYAERLQSLREAVPPVDTTMSTPEPVQAAPAKPTPKAARIKAKKAAAAEAVAPEQPAEAPVATEPVKPVEWSVAYLDERGQFHTLQYETLGEARKGAVKYKQFSPSVNASRGTDVRSLGRWVWGQAGKRGAVWVPDETYTPFENPKATPKRSRAGQRGHVIAGVPDIPGFKDWKPRWDAAKGKWLDPLGKEVPRDLMRLFAAYDRANPVAAQPESKKARVEALRRENGATLAKATPKARPTLRPAEKPALTPEWPEPKARPTLKPAEAPARAPEAPKPKAPASTGEPVSLKKAAIADVRKRLDMEELPKPVRVSNQEVLDRAIERNLSDTAMETVKQAAREKRPLTPEEHAGAVLKMAELSKEVASADKTIRELEAAGNEAGARLEAARMRGFQDQMDELTANARKTGSAAGSGLQAIKIAVDPEEFTLARVLQKARETKGAPLTDTETRMHADQVKRLEELEAKLPALEAENARLAAQHEKELAEAVMRAESAKAGIRSKAAGRRERLLSENKSLLGELKALGLQLNSGIDPQALYVLGKLAVNHMRLGAANLDEVVRLVQAEVKGISKEDVYRALNQPDPAAVKKARSQTQANIAAAKTEARLLTQIDDALKGTPRAATATTPKTPPTPRIAELRKALADIQANLGKTGRDARSIERAQAVIDDLQAQLAGHYRNLKKPKTAPPVEVEPLRARIKELRQTLRAEDTIAELEHQLATGDFPAKRPKPAPPSPELEKAQIQITDLRRDIRLSIEKRRPLNAEGILDAGINVIRTAEATADFSSTFRQNGMLVAREMILNPKNLGKNLARAMSATFNKMSDAQIHNAIVTHPYYYLARKAKLVFTDRGGGTHGEELFDSAISESVPVYGEVVKGSERHMRTLSNLMRFDAFCQFVDAHPNATSEELAGMADVLNVFSGRGNLNVSASTSKWLGRLMFAPRYAASRIQAPTMIVKYWKIPSVRAEILKTYGADVLVGASVIALAKMAGFDTGTDPNDADWGKIVVPLPNGQKAHIDIWTGQQQPARLILRALVSISNTVGLTGKGVPEVDKKFDPKGAFGQAVSSKLSPAISLPLELWTKKDAVGQPTTPRQTLAKAVTPISVQDTYEAYKAGGVKAALGVGALSAFGVGVNVYGDSEAKTRRKIRAALDKGDYETARRIAREWNKANPKAAIRSQKTTAELLKAERERRNEDK